MKTMASWCIELNTVCPVCGCDVDLLDDPDFFTDHPTLHIGESREAVSVFCPKCGNTCIASVVF